jgi:hypothetical protein
VVALVGGAQAKDVRRALAAVRSSLSRQDHRRLTASSLASTKTLVFSSFGILVFPNIRVNAFPQTHEPSESPSSFVYISQHGPSFYAQTGRSKQSDLGLSVLDCFSKQQRERHPTGIPYPKQQRRKMATHSSLTPAMFASIVSIVYRTVFFEPSYHAAICGVTSKKKAIFPNSEWFSEPLKHQSTEPGAWNFRSLLFMWLCGWLLFAR